MKSEARSFVWVRFGGFGRQLAEVVGTTPSGQVKVKKFRVRSGRWTGIVRVPTTDYISPATVEEVAKAQKAVRS